MTDQPSPEQVPPPLPADVAPAPAGPRTLPFAFEGRAAEYFRIWIVNLCLTLLTLGIYSAWATVRKKKYFYGNTWVDGSNFDYHGDPKAILRGRVIAVGAFVVYSVVAEFSPRIAAAMALAVLPAVPWLLLRSYRFNAHNSSYRHVRFGFEGAYRDMLKAVLPVFVFPTATLLFPQVVPDHAPEPIEWFGTFLPVVVFALLYPYMAARLRLIRVNGSSLGTARFACDATVRAFYGVYAVGGLIFLLAAALLIAPLGFAAASGAYAVLFALPIGYFAAFALGFGYTQARGSNLTFNHTSLEGGVRLSSDVPALRLAWIYFTNLAAVVLTLGLMIPWAAVRTAQFRAQHLRLESTGSLDSFVARSAAGVGATGDEVGEIFGFDLAL